MFSLLACGSNGRSQLGVGHADDADVLAACVFGDSPRLASPPAQVACGGNHTLVRLKNGAVFGAGDNSKGQCAQPAPETLAVFTEVAHTCKWTHVACGWDFSVLVDELGAVYVCGAGARGELGLGTVTQTPLVRLAVPFAVAALQSGMGHTIVETTDGSLYGWGNGRKGELGRLEASGPRQTCLRTPTRLDFGVPVEEFQLGKDTTFVRSQGRVRGFGKHACDVAAPPGSTFRAMWSSVHVAAGQTIESYGNFSHRQQYPGAVRIDQWAVGSEHGLVVSANKVYAWGWGEHGNCGRAVGDEVVFGRLNLVYDDAAAVVAVFGGCATSWVATEV